ncbi:MAG: OadG family protein [Spirochaetales bacterium]|jgi:oxaloacetate decarboxylase gamma subunit|nr:OadG family protein [Spirochaetales bacterium]
MAFLAQIPKEQLIVQLEYGAILMLLGLATVFVFLTLLVFLTKGTSALARKIAPQTKPATAGAAVAVTATSSASDAEVAAAIVAAYAKSKE